MIFEIFKYFYDEFERKYEIKKRKTFCINDFIFSLFDLRMFYKVFCVF